jgi:hypothetical protein
MEIGDWCSNMFLMCVCVSYVSRTCDKKRFRYCKLLNYTYKIDKMENADYHSYTISIILNLASQCIKLWASPFITNQLLHWILQHWHGIRLSTPTSFDPTCLFQSDNIWGNLLRIWKNSYLGILALHKIHKILGLPIHW